MSWQADDVGVIGLKAPPTPTDTSLLRQLSGILTRAEVRTGYRIGPGRRRRSRRHRTQHLDVGFSYLNARKPVATINGWLRLLDELPPRPFVPWAARRVVAIRHVEVDVRELGNAWQFALWKVRLDRVQGFFE
jgi:hypothetical protein